MTLRAVKLNLDSMSSNHPIEWMLNLLELRKQTHFAVKLGQLLLLDWRKPAILESSDQRIALKRFSKLVLLKSAYASSKILFLSDVVCHKQREAHAIEVAVILLRLLVVKEMLKVGETVGDQALVKVLVDRCFHI